MSMAKVVFHFTPEQRADVAIAEILSAYYRIMEANEAGIKAGTDPECLHDFRVAIRASRTILAKAQGILPTRSHIRVSAALTRLARASSQLRDLDVFLLRSDELLAELPPDTQKNLVPFLRYLLSERRTEHRRFIRLLASGGHQKFKTDYNQILSRLSSGRNRTEGGHSPIQETAGKVIWKAYRAVLKSEDLRADPPIEKLHQFRKRCKKLRYLLADFQSLYPQREINPLVKDLKQLQDKLGGLVDADVQARFLQQWREAMTQNKKTSPRTLLAIQMLEDIQARGGTPRKTVKSLNRLGRFLRPANRKRFQKLFQ
jgi:CHAD domain-containing protein